LCQSKIGLKNPTECVFLPLFDIFLTEIAKGCAAYSHGEPGVHHNQRKGRAG
tara:strand:+ start:235 stop:390 length:156 start_codon:yes stop_codon:yes gene_type:complete